MKRSCQLTRALTIASWSMRQFSRPNRPWKYLVRLSLSEKQIWEALKLVNLRTGRGRTANPIAEASNDYWRSYSVRRIYNDLAIPELLFLSLFLFLKSSHYYCSSILMLYLPMTNNDRATTMESSQAGGHLVYMSRRTFQEQDWEVMLMKKLEAVFCKPTLTNPHQSELYLDFLMKNATL